MKRLTQRNPDGSVSLASTVKSGEILERLCQMEESVPVIDAVPVVRCKDCEYSNTDHAISDKGTWCDYWGVDPDFDDFCSHGKRKGGDER